MIYNIRKIFTILSLMILGGVLVYNCEPEPDSLGEQLFLDGAANGKEVPYDITAYNISNNDTIRADANTLYNLLGSTANTSATGVLGAFNESQFGMQKATYFTQLRLPANDPDFGTNAVVDSVVLVLKPIYRSDSITTTTDENYVYSDGNVDAKKVVNTYPAVKYGKAKKKMNIQVQEVIDFMNGYNDPVYSNTNFAVNSTVLGSKEFSGNVNAITITKDSDGSSLFSSAAGFRIPLSPTFFQSKIIAKKGQPELKDVSNFIRYFRGLKISVEESDGYLFQFYPNDMELIMYYKNDKVENGQNTRPQLKYSFSIGSANAHSGYYQYDRSGAAVANFTPDMENGDKKLFAQGMGGNSIGIKLPVLTINELKKMYQDQKAAIISAKIRLYIDDAVWSNPYAKPSAFTILQGDKDTNGKTVFDYTTDYSVLGSASTFVPFRTYDTTEGYYYEFTVTQSLKDIVESGKDYKDKFYKIDLAQFISTSAGSLAGFKYTSRPFSMGRTVFVGTDPSNVKNAKLRVTYGTK